MSEQLQSASSFVLKPQYAAAIRWSSRGSCGMAGCADPECCCSLCGGPIGVSEEDPRRANHDEEFCAGCAICQDDVPLMLFRGEGKGTEQAQFHTACFSKITHFRSSTKSEG